MQESAVDLKYGSPHIYADRELDYEAEYKPRARRVFFKPLWALLAMIMVVLFVFGLIVKANYTSVSDNNAKLRREYENAVAEQKRLELDYACVLESNSIEQLATTRLGMHAQSENFVKYVGSEPGTQVIVVKEGGTRGNILGLLSDILNRLSAYFIAEE
ncbi:MAG: hypothetical protein LBD85_06665 [Oscillospiraceae bacterium]|jgi:cell division protein FtsL|nr:hypothetical protein [Oscillospiraceae bacterium]